MKKNGLCLFYFLAVLQTWAQGIPDSTTIFKISRADLAGENLVGGVQAGETDTSYYQQRIYDGKEFIVFLFSIKNRTNTFERFPIEEFVFWADGKAIVEPESEPSFEVVAGDYFIQPKGFKGKFNFVSGDEPHLELALVSKRRADSASVSPMTKALLIDPTILAGSSEDHQGELVEIYSGIELTVNLVRHAKRTFSGKQKERLMHVLSGILTAGEETFYPGDFFIIPANFSGDLTSIGFRPFRGLEVYQVDPK